jgi:hypothetical protein
MVPSKFGAERVATEDFSELIATLLQAADVEAVELFVATVLCSNALGGVDGSMTDFRTYMHVFGSDIANCLAGSAAQC